MASHSTGNQRGEEHGKAEKNNHIRKENKEHPNGVERSKVGGETDAGLFSIHPTSYTAVFML